MTLRELGLTTPCRACEGTTMQTRYDRITGQPVKVICEKCRGVGDHLTEEGEKLARLISFK